MVQNIFRKWMLPVKPQVYADTMGKEPDSCVFNKRAYIGRDNVIAFKDTGIIFKEKGCFRRKGFRSTSKLMILKSIL